MIAELGLTFSRSTDAQVRYRWGVNDLAIWDNRSTNHCAFCSSSCRFFAAADPSRPSTAATFDYSALRKGDRAVCCGEKPYYDPNGLSRKAYMDQQVRA